MKEDGGAAFPSQHEVGSAGEYQLVSSEGMSLRDYFAAKAMQALVSAMPHMHGTRGQNGGPLTEDDISSQSYDFADAMLEARK